MKTLMTTAAVLAVLTAPVFAQGGQTAGSESRGEPQASSAKESAKDPTEKGAMGQGQAQPRATTGAASESAKKDPTKESAGRAVLQARPAYRAVAGAGAPAAAGERRQPITERKPTPGRHPGSFAVANRTSANENF